MYIPVFCTCIVAVVLYSCAVGVLRWLGCIVFECMCTLIVTLCALQHYHFDWQKGPIVFACPLLQLLCRCVLCALLLAAAAVLRCCRRRQLLRCAPSWQV